MNPPILSIKTTLFFIWFSLAGRKTQSPFRLPHSDWQPLSLLAQFGEINSLLSEDEDKRVCMVWPGCIMYMVGT